MQGLDRWKGKVALVTGASSGIGQAIARALAGAGMKVAATARRRERLDALASELESDGAEVRALTADMGVEEQIRALFPAVHEAFGSVDVLVNCAGTGSMSTFEAGSANDWREILNVNVIGLSICTHAALTDMAGKEDALVINISSIYAHRPQVPNFSYYQASKFAVQALTNTLRAELHASGSKIRVAMISPGLTATEFRERATGGAFSYESYFKDMQPLVPDDIARAALYTLSNPSHVQVLDILISPVGQGL